MMRVIIVTAGCLVIGVAIAAPPVRAQQPIREGLRATGEAAGAVARGAGEVAEGTVDAGRAVIGGAARGLAAGVDALTPDLPLQARAGATLSAADRAREARWRFAQHNGEWWYYSPESRWMYHRNGDWNEFAEDSFVPNAGAGQFGGEYASGYRGVEQGGAMAPEQYAGEYGGGQVAEGQVYHLQHDENGREFICDNGQRVYFDGQAGAEGQWGSPTPGVPTEAGYRGTTDQPATGAPTLPADSAPAAGAIPPVSTAPATGGTPPAATTPPAVATPPSGATPPTTTAPAAGAGVEGTIQGGLPGGTTQ